MMQNKVEPKQTTSKPTPQCTKYLETLQNALNNETIRNKNAFFDNKSYAYKNSQALADLLGVVSASHDCLSSQIDPNSQSETTFKRP